MTKINLGSGPSGINGWVNVDYGMLPWLSKHPRFRKILTTLHFLPRSYDIQWPEIIISDIRKRLPFANATADYVYCSQVIEHLEYYEAKKLIKEIFRLLKTGGIARISVPDISKIVKLYQKEASTNALGAARNFNIIIYGHEKDLEPKSIIAKLSRLFIRGHFWHYNYQSIRHLLRDSGFKKISKCDFQKGKCPNIKQLDKIIHEPHSLYVEVQK